MKKLKNQKATKKILKTKELPEKKLDKNSFKFRLPRLTIKIRIIFTFVLILAITGLISLFSIAEMNEINSNITRIKEERMPQLNYASQLSSKIASFRYLEYNHVLSETDKLMELEEGKMTTLYNEIESIFTYYKEVVTDDLKPIINQQYAQWQNYIKTHSQLLELSKSDKKEAQSFNAMDIKIAYDTLVIKTNDMVNANIKSIEDINKAGIDEYNNSKKVLNTAFSAAFILTLVLGLMLVLGVIPPIRKMQIKLSDLVKNGGDLTQKINIKSKNEIGELAVSINLFLENLREIISDVKGETDVLNGTVDSINSNLNGLTGKLEDVSATTEEISAGMQETAATAETMEGLSNNLQAIVEEVANKSKAGTNLATEITKRAIELKENAAKSGDSANLIKKEVNEELRLAIEKSKAVTQINELTESILAVTAQTNLLSLNASIEAARAGEAGRGFAVVADEIGNLAELSKQTAGKIREITKVVVESVDNLSSSSQRVLEFLDNQVEKDYKTQVQTGEQYQKDAQTFNTIVTDIKDTTGDLTYSIKQMLQSIAEISIATNEGALGSNEIAEKTIAISEEAISILDNSKVTKEGANKLKEVVGKFTT